MGDRITREVTPFVEVLRDPIGRKPRILRSIPAGDIVLDDGRAVLRVPGPGGARDQLRLLLDPDGALWESLIAVDPTWLDSPFEVNLDRVPALIPDEIVGRTWVVPADEGVPRSDGGITAIRLLQGAAVPDGAQEVHWRLDTSAPPPVSSVPAVGLVDFARPEAVDGLPALLHAMGAGRAGLREVRLIISPLAYQGRGRRPPFLSEVIEAIANGLGVPIPQITRELVFRTRLSDLGIRRHLLPDPYFVTFTFRGHRSRGLVPATTLFSLPKRGSRRDVLRGTPESEHDNLLEYFGLLEDPAPRLAALASRSLYAVSVHVLPNPDVPIYPNHGGIVHWDGHELRALEGA